MIFTPNLAEKNDFRAYMYFIKADCKAGLTLQNFELATPSECPQRRLRHNDIV